MGILFSKLFALIWAAEEVKILILGLDNSGKSTILYRLSMGATVATTPTLGANVEELSYRNLKIIMWDLGGQASLRASWSAYYSGARSVILVVDSTDRDRMPIVREELARIMSHELLKKSALLVFANKQDVKGAMMAAEISTALSLTAIKDRPWTILPSCGLTGEGLKEGLEWVVQNVNKG
ncbi:ADP-ribosylation factor 2 [Hyaloraphidium curvatum]|nr:ADP-ribosylation factor 2 [Hyaloraphidium curvatum]